MPNPFESTVETLRAAEPRPEAVNRAVAALRRPHPPRLVPLAVGVAAVSAALLWPHGSSGVAWAQIAAQDLPLRYHETQVVVAGGRSRMLEERWIDRTKDSDRNHLWIFDRTIEHGESVAAIPLGREQEWVETPKGFYGRQNDFATFTRKPQAKSRFDPRLTGNVVEQTGLATLLRDKSLRQIDVERNVPTRVGPADRYTLAPSPGETSYVVYVQPGTKRIIGSDERAASGDVYQMTLDYPDRFPADLFAIPPEGAKAYDLDALNAKVDARLAKPLATLRAGGQTVVLRLVAQDDHKDLWVLWSGARPNGDLAQRVRVLGMRNGAVHSALPYVAKDSVIRHSPFGGESVALDRRVERVDLQIPVFAPGKGRSRFVGDATVGNVPVLHLPFVDGLDSLRGRKVPPSMVNVYNAPLRMRKEDPPERS